MKQKINCILLIDDDSPTNFYHRLIIEDAGVTRHVKIAGNVKKAMTYILKCKEKNTDPEYIFPDLIFLDINMPGLTGWDFLEWLRLDMPDMNTDVIIVMLTTSLNAEDKRKADQYKELKGFYNKPLSEQLLEEIITKYFPEK